MDGSGADDAAVIIDLGYSKWDRFDEHERIRGLCRGLCQLVTPTGEHQPRLTPKSARDAPTTSVTKQMRDSIGIVLTPCFIAVCFLAFFLQEMGVGHRGTKFDSSVEHDTWGCVEYASLHSSHRNSSSPPSRHRMWRDVTRHREQGSVSYMSLPCCHFRRTIAPQRAIRSRSF